MSPREGLQKEPGINRDYLSVFSYGCSGERVNNPANVEPDLSGPAEAGSSRQFFQTLLSKCGKSQTSHLKRLPTPALVSAPSVRKVRT